MTNKEAFAQSETSKHFENVRELGRMFAIGIKEVTGKQIKNDSDLMNGIAAYQILELKGKWEYMDESIDVVMRMAYDLLVENLDKKAEG